MPNPTRILYLGTYERAYPRNYLMVAALRRAGFDVIEAHAEIWGGTSDKTTLLSSPLSLARLVLRLIGAYLRLVRDARRRIGQSDIVMFGYIGQLDVLLLGSLARLAGKPVVFNPLLTLTDTLIEDRQSINPRGIIGRAVRLLDRISLVIPHVLLVDTIENRDYLSAQFGVDPTHVHVVPVGADESLFLPICSMRPPVERTPSVLFYGTMIPLQGVDTIVRAAHLLQNDDVQIEMIGSGQMLGSAQALAETLGVSNISWTTRVPYAELPLRISDADIVLGIFGDSLKAGRVVPNKVYQAMAMGAAIITRDSAAQRTALENGVSALLVPAADPTALAEAIRQLRDPALRARLGRAARRRFIETASSDVQVRQLRVALEPYIARSARSQIKNVPT